MAILINTLLSLHWKRSADVKNPYSSPIKESLEKQYKHRETRDRTYVYLSGRSASIWWPFINKIAMDAEQFLIGRNVESNSVRH